MVSVCMATYNGGKYIKEQIDSILPQLEGEDELIVSDDGSNDNTVDVIRSFGDYRIKLLHNTGRHGYAWNFENALREAKGDIIFLSDQDDIWMPEKVKVAKAILSDCDMIVHNARIVDGEAVDKGVDYFSLLHSHEGFWWNWYKTRCLGCCMVFKSAVLRDCLPFPDNIVAHDYWIGLYALLSYRVKFYDKCLLKYRRHGNNASPSGEKSNSSLYYQLYQKRLNTLFALLKHKLSHKSTVEHGG